MIAPRIEVAYFEARCITMVPTNLLDFFFLEFGSEELTITFRPMTQAERDASVEVVDGVLRKITNKLSVFDLTDGASTRRFDVESRIRELNF
jgi:hypothetical protein